MGLRSDCFSGIFNMLNSRARQYIHILSLFWYTTIGVRIWTSLYCDVAQLLWFPGYNSCITSKWFFFFKSLDCSTCSNSSLVIFYTLLIINDCSWSNSSYLSFVFSAICQMNNIPHTNVGRWRESLGDHECLLFHHGFAEQKQINE